MRSYAVLAGLSMLGGLGLLGNCKNADPTTGTTLVAGQAVESQTLKPVGGATVQVYHASSGGGYVPVGTGHAADKQGRFSFAFDADSKTGYLVRATAPPGYFTDWAAAPYLTAGRSNEGLTVPMLAPAWVRLQLVDSPPQSRAVISINGYNGGGDVLYYPRDTVLIRPIEAGFKSAISWEINSNSVSTRNSIFIQPSSLDTVTVRITF